MWFRFVLAILWAVSVVCAAGNAAAIPLSSEIHTEHPLFLFEAPGRTAEDGFMQSATISEAWDLLPDVVRPYAMMRLAAEGGAVTEWDSRYEEVLLNIGQIPTVITVADGHPNRFYPVDRIGELFDQFPHIRGVHVLGIEFDQYHQFSDYDARGVPPHVQWLRDLVQLAVDHGRFVVLELGELHWPRLMTNPWTEALYTYIAENPDHVIPLNRQLGPHNIGRTSSLMGSWLEGAVSNWGLMVSSEWYTAAGFVEPGVFGTGAQGGAMPPNLYRAMILNGVMTGATVYRFDASADLWYGNRRHYWDEAIFPLLAEVLDKGFIARRDMVLEQTRAAYRMNVAASPQAFHENLQDIDGVLDAGHMIRGAYGMQRPGQIPELILDNGRHFWIPILSPYVSEAALRQFDEVILPGALRNAAEWSERLDALYPDRDTGDAFAAVVGRGIYVMHTRENLYEEQTYRIEQAPAPVRRIGAERRQGGISLSWQFREGDFTYRVFRRVLPNTTFELMAQVLDTPRYFDPDVPLDATVAYTVTALTSEVEPMEGTVNFGQYLAMSGVESRIEEQVIVGPTQQSAVSESTAPGRTSARPDGDLLAPVVAPPAEHGGIARALIGRIESFAEHFQRADAAAMMDLYSVDYIDAEGWGREYVQAAYQAFFDLYATPRMHRQVRRWDFTALETDGRVRVLVYCRMTGIDVDAGDRADRIHAIPRLASGEVWITFTDEGGTWRIVESNPPLPRLKDVLTAAEQAGSPEVAATFP